jgi:hypothetical protein
MCVFDRCLSPIRGLSMRERRDAGRGDVGCAISESEEEEEEPLDIEGDVEERGGISLVSGSFIEAGSGRGAVTAGDDVVLRIRYR